MTGIYVRVSTQEQAKGGYSIGEQIDRLTKYCDAMGWGQPRTYTDPGYSGGNTDRPALQELIADAKNKRINRVVVYKLDRLSRSQLDTLYLIEKVFLANDVAFVSMSENFDTSTPFGKAMVGILAVFAQLEREQIKERMMLGADARKKAGKWHGGICPYGYDYKEGTLVLNDYEAAQIKEMFKLFIGGMPLSQIQREFAEKGYANRSGEWTLYRIRYILNNPLYAGYLKDGDALIKGIHSAIVSKETFDKAASLLQSNRDNYFSSGKVLSCGHKSTMLGGLLYCRRCGARYGKSKSGKTGDRHPTYCCYSRSKVNKVMVRDPACQNKIYPVKTLDEMVLNEIRKLSIEPLENTPEHTDSTFLLEQEIDRINTQQARLLDLYVTGKYSAEQLDIKHTELEERKEKIERQISEISRKKLTKRNAVKISSSLDEILNKADFNDLRAIVETLIDHIDIDGEDIYIHWKF